jgi:hypothetical protein
LSYARTDDRDIQFVSKLAKELERAFQSRTGRPLRIFVDTREIATAEIWQESIRNALENSTVMVAALTPSYFTSEWCGREWDHFRTLEDRHRRQIGLPASRSLIFPIQFISLDKVLDLEREARQRMREAHTRQIKDLVEVGPDSQRFKIAVKELASEMADVFQLLKDLASASTHSDPPTIGLPAFRSDDPSGPQISTRIGNQEKFIDRLSEAARVTLLGIAHGGLTDFLDEALKRKRRREGPTAFWPSIRVIFASESLLPLVRDELDEQFPDRDAAIKVRFQRVGRGRRAVASFFLLSNRPNQWSMYEYPYLLPFVGALFEMSDGSKLAQVATFRPYYRVGDYLFVEFAGTAGELAYYQAAFEDVVINSVQQDDVTLAGVPNDPAPGFRCLGSRFRRSVMLPGRGKPSDWLPVVLITTYWTRPGSAELLLQVRTRENANHELGKLSHISGFINQQDHGELEAAGRVGFDLPHSAARNAALRTLREELELVGDDWELELVDQLRYHSASHESLYFYVFSLGLPRTVSSFPNVAELRPWALSDVLRLRRYQVLSQAARVLAGIPLTAWQAELVGKLLKFNLTLHDLEGLGEEVSAHVYLNEAPGALVEEIQRLRQETALVNPGSTGLAPIEGLTRLQYRELFSRLLPIYERIGVHGAREELAEVSSNSSKRSALDELVKLYASEPDMRNLPIEV